MSVTFDESMLDFDLNFLQPTATPSESFLEKQRKQIGRVKKKTILTSAVINQNTILKKKCAEFREKWEQNKVLLLTSKEECKQACINYQQYLGKCTQLEKDLKTEKDLNVELDSKYTLTQNQYEGMKSYANQLQFLIKKYEAEIEGLKAEKKEDHTDDYEKKLSLVQQEKKVLLKHLSLATDIIMGKRKLRKRHKILLLKYNHLELSNDDSSSDSSGDEPEFLDVPPHSPHSSVFTSCEDSAGDKANHDIFKLNSSESTMKKDLIKFNEDDSASEDTGRGSSLAFSDKCFSSPDYFDPNSPIRENIKINEKPTVVDSATSPLRNVATSPRIYDDEMLLSGTNTLFRHVHDSNTKGYFITDETPFSDEIITIKEKRTLVETGTSPIKNSEWNSSEYYISGDSTVSDEIVTIKEKKTLLDEVTSPIKDLEWNGLEYIICGETPLSNEIVTIKEQRKLVNVGTSPVKDIGKVHIATSPLSVIENFELDTIDVMLVAKDGQICNVNDSCRSDISGRKTPCIQTDNTVTGVNGKHTKIDNLASHCELEISDKSIEERKCLEKNQSTTICDVNTEDGDVEMILNTMRLKFDLLSPIPASPVSTHENENVEEPVQTLSEYCEREGSCEVILREENKILRTDLEHLKKEIVDVKKQMEEMKSWVNNMFNNSKSKFNEEVLVESNNISASPETFDDMSQETIIIYPNDKTSDTREENELTSSISNFNLSAALRNSKSTQLKDASENMLALNTLQDSSVISCISKHATTCIASKSCHFVENCPTNINSIEHESDTDTLVPLSKNDSREAITFEEDIMSEGENDILMNTGVENIVEDFNKCGKYKKRKNTKLSKLEKFKQKLKPKCKISKPTSVRKLLSKIKLKPVTVTLTKMDPNVILNNKLAYEYAAKIMAEEKAKEKDSSIKKRVARTTRKVVDDKKENSLDNNTSFEQEQQQSKSNLNQTQRQIRRKSKDQQDSNDICSESIKEVDWKDDVPMTRSRSRKLSNSANASSIEEDTREKDISFSGRKRKPFNREATDRPIFERKRVLRSTYQESCDLEHVQEVKLSDIAETIPSKWNHQLSVSGSDKQIISHHNKNDCNVSSKIQNRKLSKTEMKKQSTDENFKNSYSPKRASEGNPDRNHIINAANIPKHITDRKPSSSENKKQDDNVKVICKSNKIQDRTLSPSQDRKSFTDNVDKNSKMSKDDRNKTEADELISHPKNSILCKMLEKHGRGGMKHLKTVPDNTINRVHKRLEESIASIHEMPVAKAKPAMDKLVDEVQSWEERLIMLGLMQYLKDPNRKNEQFNRVNCPPAPDMTKSEQVLLYIVRQMENMLPNSLYAILSHIEYSLFKLNRTPDFDIIENLSRFYALLCRYFGLKTRLRLFILDAMYCLKYKVIPVIKQCLDVWMHILPLAHMGIAKSPLVTSLVYLLHFYKCEDKYKKRAVEIRIILKRKYFYEITDWNEPMILEMFRNAIKDVRDISAEKKMLRMALIILGKRQGPQWCNKNIIKNMLMPMIESDNVPMKTKQFCVQMLGPLLKPFPADMKLHFEIAANYLYEMLDQNPPDAMKEAIFTSLIYIGHHNPNRLTRVLLSWMPKKISPEFEEIMKDYVRAKTLFTWKKILPRISI